MPRKHIVILDENVNRAQAFCGLLDFAGISYRHVSSNQIMRSPPTVTGVRAVVVGDIPDRSISVLMQTRRQEFPEAPVLAFNSHPRVTGEHNSQVLEDPFDLEALSQGIAGTAYKNRRQRQPNLAELYASMLKKINVVAPCHASVTLTGESSMVRGEAAKLIHEKSQSPGPFVKITCFERVYGAEDIFSLSQYQNSLRLINGGTLFLDRVDRLSKSSQHTILALLRNKAIGGTRQTKRSLDFRLLAGALVPGNDQARVLPELWHRLSICRIDLPYLPKRLTDIRNLLNDLIVGTDVDENVPVSDSLARINRYGWPENLRGLAEISAWLKVMSLRSKFEFPCQNVGTIDDLLACLELLPQKVAYRIAHRAQDHVDVALAKFD